VLLVTTRFERLTAPSTVKLQVRVVLSTSVAVQLNVGLLLDVCSASAGALRVSEGAVVSTVKLLVADVAELFAISQQVTAQVWAPSANAEVEVLV